MVTINIYLFCTTHYVIPYDIPAKFSPLILISTKFSTLTLFLRFSVDVFRIVVAHSMNSYISADTQKEQEITASK